MLSVAVTLSAKPLRDPKRRSSFYGSLVLCSVLRPHSGSDAAASPRFSQQHLDALFEVYEPTRRSKAVALEDIDRTLEFLRHWGFHYDDIYSCVSAYPQLLGRELAKVTALFDELSALGFTPTHIKAMVRRYPRLLKVNSEKLQPMQRYFVDTLLLTEPQFVKLVTLWPSTLTLRLEENIIPTCDYLLEALGLEEAQLGKMLTRFPQILACSLEAKLKPMLHYFLEEIGVSRDAFAKRIKHQPSVLGRSAEALREHVTWLQALLGYSEDDLRRLFSLSLHVFQQGQSKLETKIDNLCAHFELDRHQCGALIKHYPQILTISVQNVNETMAYLTQVMHRDPQDIVRCPTILWCSLSNRIKPRHQALLALEFPQSDYALGTLYGCTDDRFEQLLDRQLTKSETRIT